MMIRNFTNAVVEAAWLRDFIFGFVWKLPLLYVRKVQESVYMWININPCKQQII